MASYNEYPVHVTAWAYMFGAVAMILTAVLGDAANLAFLVSD